MESRNNYSDSRQGSLEAVYRHLPQCKIELERQISRHSSIDKLNFSLSESSRQYKSAIN